VRISLGTERIFEAIDRIADTIERLNKEKQKPKITA